MTHSRKAQEVRFMRYYLHIPIPNRLSRFVRAIETRYQGESRSEPHLTIISPHVLLHGVSENQLIEAVERAALAIIPFYVRLQGFGCFDDMDTVFIKVERSRRLTACHRALMESLVEVVEASDNPFVNLPTPHITLADHLKPRKCQELINWIGAVDVPPGFKSFEVVLLAQTKRENPWRVIHIASFKGLDNLKRDELAALRKKLAHASSAELEELKRTLREPVTE